MDGPKQQRYPSARGVLLVFSLCALADFVWSMFKGRSVAESAISAILGMFGTAWYVLIMWGASRNDPDRWVP